MSENRTEKKNVKKKIVKCKFKLTNTLKNMKKNCFL